MFLMEHVKKCSRALVRPKSNILALGQIGTFGVNAARFITTVKHSGGSIMFW